MPASPPTFRWTEAYSVHIAELDAQHQRLFATIEELNQALREGKGSSAIDSVLGQLVNYAAEHFAAEESLMAQHEYPGLSTHRAQHDLFRKKIAAFLEEHAAAKPGVPVALMFFMQGWLKQHVLKTDQQYSAFLNARGVH